MSRRIQYLHHFTKLILLPGFQHRPTCYPTSTQAYGDQSKVSFVSSVSLTSQQKVNKSDACRVRLFVRWLRSQQINEGRELVNIPMEEMDAYLANFFSVVKTNKGCEFSVSSLTAVRNSLDRHLRSQGYTEAISSSPRFRQSQLAFLRKMENAKIQEIRRNQVPSC